MSNTACGSLDTQHVRKVGILNRFLSQWIAQCSEFGLQIGKAFGVNRETPAPTIVVRKIYKVERRRYQESNAN